MDVCMGYSVEVRVTGPFVKPGSSGVLGYFNRAETSKSILSPGKERAEQWVLYFISNQFNADRLFLHKQDLVSAF